ncbi:MAG: Lrp/AsnC family transcriptional regulator [Aigarchaeota archaeon]|nr:Lrp/AsnC family transcriptional regulator [Aigarchaeota archaeon]MDH5702597.1 Lrp/AsnC family transcriptional regulator [Aigarchaeota archaeon]
MNEKDESILRVLEKNAKLSSREIGKEVGLPPSTVHRRIKRMEEDEVIKGYRAIVDYEKTERPIGAYLFVNEAETTPRGHIPKSKIIDDIRKFHEVQELVDVQAGNFDLVLKARVRSLKELSSFTERLRNVEGIQELSTAIIVQEIL